MKYFKHHCNASDREFLQIVLDQFSHEGYTLWFGILEVLGQEVEKEIESFRRGASVKIRPIMTVGISFLAKRARTSPDRVLEFAKFARKKGKYSIARARLERDQITIECPNFLENIDEYTRKLIKEVCTERGIDPKTVLTVSGVTPEPLRLPPLPSPPLPPLGGKPPPARDSDRDDSISPASTGQKQADAEMEKTLDAVQAFQTPRRDTKRTFFEDLLRQKVSHARIRAAYAKGSDKDFFVVYRTLANGKADVPFVPSGPDPHADAAKAEHDRQHREGARKLDAKDLADQKLADVPPEEVAAWTREAEELAVAEKIPEYGRGVLLRSHLRKKAAAKFGIEGL